MKYYIKKYHVNLLMPKKEQKYNTIKFFNLHGDEVGPAECEYAQLLLLGGHASRQNAHMLISKCDIECVTEFLWYLGKDGYPVTYSSVDKEISFSKGYKIHRFVEQNVPPGMVVDHINRNKLDNRRENLRICTMAENSYNKTSISQKTGSKYKGVRKDNKNEWSASVTKDGKKYEMKHLPDEITAAKMYDLMAEELFGQFCAKNNPVSE